ncbi:hypothetical protein M0R45_001374 [Rubus argutus]|uniref:Uncharacterized protein n=1 Tax=Rubus argutus TaxID=59490 RepID=A0AAW1VLW0_RUBAR
MAQRMLANGSEDASEQVNAGGGFVGLLKAVARGERNRISLSLMRLLSPRIQRTPNGDVVTVLASHKDVEAWDWLIERRGGLGSTQRKPTSWGCAQPKSVMIDFIFGFKREMMMSVVCNSEDKKRRVVVLSWLRAQKEDDRNRPRFHPGTVLDSTQEPS